MVEAFGRVAPTEWGIACRESNPGTALAASSPCTLSDNRRTPVRTHFLLVPRGRVELPRPMRSRGLSPPRLPLRHLGSIDWCRREDSNLQTSSLKRRALCRLSYAGTRGPREVPRLRGVRLGGWSWIRTSGGQPSSAIQQIAAISLSAIHPLVGAAEGTCTPVAYMARRHPGC